MKKSKRIVIFILSCIVMLSFGLTAYADNTSFSTGRFYTPIFSVDAVGNFSSVGGSGSVNMPSNMYAGTYGYASIIQPPTDVLIPTSMFVNENEEYYLRNERNWHGLYNTSANAGYHQSAVTTRFYNEYDIDGNLTLRSETQLYNFAGNSSVMGFLDEVCVKDTYFESMQNISGKKIFDGLVVKGTTLDSINGSYHLYWSQYERDVNEEISLVRRSANINLSDVPYYEEYIQGTLYYVRAIAFFDPSFFVITDALNDQVYAYEGDESIYYMQDIEFQLYQNGSAALNLYNTYDETDEISASVGGYLKSVTTYIDFEDISYTDWLVNSVGAFFNFQIVPGFSLGGVFAAIIGILLLKSFVNAFAGG